MAGRNTVLRSIETPAGDRCVDLFRRPDGSFGFGVYRRDVEDARGWYATGDGTGGVYPSLQAALDAARDALPWLAEIMGGER